MLTLSYEEIFVLTFWKGILIVFPGIPLESIVLFSNIAMLHCASCFSLLIFS